MKDHDHPGKLPLRGDTYPVRVQLAGLGGTWCTPCKQWYIPADRVDIARSIVASMKRVQQEIAREKRHNNKGRRGPDKPLFSPR